MIDAKTTLCCLIGNPVEHSFSPAIHNAAYQALGLNFVYLAFKVSDLKKAIEGIRALGIRGASVTIPHKVAVLKYLDEVDQEAEKIGAVNTIVNQGGVLKGYNSDCQGAIKALEEKTEIAGKKTILLGAGGAACALAVGLAKKGAKVIVLNRTLEKAKRLAKLAHLEGFGDLSNLEPVKSADILINATSVGMFPKVNESLVPQKFLHPQLVVFDIVYNPKETMLIKDAQKVGAKVVFGERMLTFQAAAQFELFTGKKAPLLVMEKALTTALEKRR